MKYVLITGATGFVGHFLCTQLLAEGYRVRGTILAFELPSSLFAGVDPAVIEPLGPYTPWQHALTGIDTIIHLAARVHIMNDSASDPLTEFRKVNVAGTIQLAREAVKAGVKRLVYISSIKVNGEESAQLYTTDSPACPSDPYGISKWEAEQALRKIEAETGLEVVIVRPTLVYGPGVKANFLNMMKIISRGIPLPLASIKNKRSRISNFGFWILNFGLKGGIPLPFASIRNRRSLIYVGNLVDALAICATHPNAAGKTYLVSDGEDVSTPELIRRTASAIGVSARLFPVPVSLMKLAGKLTGKSGAVNRLTGSLTVNSSKIRRELGWVPPFTMEEGLGETARWFKNR